MSQVLFEIKVLGNSVKVCAIDERTRIEAVVVVPKTISIEMAKKQAVNKLKYLIEKQK